tara:strand:+ start:115 stop:804 length:690 start_codon:yes stop_codon:yes gene_type:complete
MRQSINKQRIYFYLIILFFTSTSFNFTTVLKFKDINLIKNIDIKGLDYKEEDQLRDKLNILKNSNIFFIKKEKIENILNIFNFLDNFYIHKVFPSKLIVYTKKTNFLGISIIDGKKYYIGSNGKLTIASQVSKEENLPMVFGNFSVNDFLKFRKILEKENIDLNKINKYFYYKSKRWDLVDDKGLILMLPYNNIIEALKIYKNLSKNEIASSVKIIDLRIPNNLILTNE